MICLKPYKDKCGLEFPCGRCMPCRINRVREWAIRMLHEYESFHGKALFITLTYAPEFLPENSTLVKSDLQKFFKRLRKNLHGRFIKYFACGEYGTKGRPHYHAIIFGIDRADVKIVKKCWTYQADFLWCKGKSYDDVNQKTCSYVAGYIQKKLYGKVPNSVYSTTGRIPPFQLQSQGIGYQYFIANFDRLMSIHGCPWRGKVAPLPRYYKKKLKVCHAFPPHFSDSLTDYYTCMTHEHRRKRFAEARKRGLSHSFYDPISRRFKSVVNDEMLEYVYQANMVEHNINYRFNNTIWRNKVE